MTNIALKSSKFLCGFLGENTELIILNVDFNAFDRERVLQMVPVHCVITNREPGASVFPYRATEFA